MNIGQNIKTERKKKELTQVQLATMIGVTESMINQIENNVKMPSLMLALALADVLGTTVDDLVR